MARALQGGTRVLLKKLSKEEYSMNLKMLYLILNDNRLRYLRHGWHQRQGEDPVASYLLYKMHSCFLTAIILLVTICAVSGSYFITGNLIGMELFNTTIPVKDNIITMIPTFLILLSSLIIVFRYQHLYDARWGKARQFLEDVWTLQSVVGRSSEDKGLMCLLGEPYSRTVPAYVRQRLREKIISLARSVIEDEIDKKPPSQKKERVKELVSVGRRLTIFPEEIDVQSFYVTAARRGKVKV